MDRAAGLSTAIEYYGADVNIQMQNFHASVSAGTDPRTAYERAFRAEPPAIPKERKDKMLSAVKADQPGLFAFGSEALGGDAQNEIVHMMSPYFDRVKAASPGIGDRVAATQALGMLKADGLETSGKFFWKNPRGVSSVVEASRMSPDIFENYFEDMLSKRLRKAGVSLDGETRVEIRRLPDDKAGVRMIVTAYRDGDAKTVWVTGADIKTLRDRDAEAQVEGSLKLKETPLSEYYSAPGMFDTR